MAPERAAWSSESWQTQREQEARREAALVAVADLVDVVAADPAAVAAARVPVAVARVPVAVVRGAGQDAVAVRVEKEARQAAGVMVAAGVMAAVRLRSASRAIWWRT